MNPLVSIVIPVYNGANYMREAIESALNQTYEHIEVIVVNDGSDDEGATERIAKSYGDRIRYLYKENGGVSSALNVGISEMRGQYFSWLSHDDKYAPDKIRSQVKLLEKFGYRDDVLAICGSCSMDKDSNVYSAKERHHFPNGKLIEHKEVLSALLKKGAFNGCALLIPKTVFDRCGVFNENLRFCQDYLMWVKIFLDQNSLVYSENKLVYGRVHAAQVTQTRRDLFYQDSAAVCDLILDDIAELSTGENNLLYDYAFSNAKRNNVYVVGRCEHTGRERHLISAVQLLKIRTALLYGRIRPQIRKLYYKLFRHMNVQ